MADVGINVRNLLAVGLMAALFIIAIKIASAKFPVKGVNEVVQSI